ncbi:hypothetical protein, partial [Ideonella sp.]|uniref:hypothetical protein n=1 Tax=Ideonella sp. TaxID=1929293 RepID=UPI003BB68B71
ILQDERFCHDLMRDAALQHLPQAVRKLLHAQWAELLASDPRVPAGHLAEHWAAAERWAEAGEACFRAGLAAHQTGRLDDNSRLMLRAADWFERAGLPQRRIDALCQRLDAELVRVGGAVVVAQALDLLEQDVTPLQRAELLQVACEAWLNLADFDAVLARAPALMEASALWPARLSGSLCLQARALAAQHQTDDALPLLQRAVALAEQHAAQDGDEAPLAHALGHLAYACYMQGHRLPEAMATQRRAADMALRLGDPADHAIHSSNLATMLQLQGEPAAALAQAELTHQSYRRLHASAGHAAAINDLTLGLCAWHQGQAGPALAVLTTAEQNLSTDGAPPAAVLKAQVALADVWLQLGQPGRALACLVATPAHRALAPAMFQALWHFARWRALPPTAESDRAAAQAAALATAAQVPNLALGPGLLRDWMSAVPTADALAALPSVESAAQASHALGLLRSLRLMRMCRLQQAGQWADAHALACAALDDRELSLHTATHPLQAWRWLAEVFEANGDTSRAGTCHQAARQWAESAAQTLPDGLAAPFLATLRQG